MEDKVVVGVFGQNDAEVTLFDMLLALTHFDSEEEEG